jgi:hypothetical protein
VRFVLDKHPVLLRKHVLLLSGSLDPIAAGNYIAISVAAAPSSAVDVSPYLIESDTNCQVCYN